MAMHADRSAVNIRHASFKRLNDACVLRRYRVTDGVRYVDDRRALVYHSGDDLAKIVQIAARRVFGGKLDVLGKAPRQPYRLACHLKSLIASFLQFVLKMNVRRG